MYRFATAFLFAAAALAAGCNKDKPTPPTEVKNKGEHDHAHDGSTQDAEAPGGKACHVELEAHLSKKGDHELEISFKTQDKAEKPLPIPENTKLTATVRRLGDEKVYPVEFKPAPKDEKERKDDPAGQCSHFEADAKWMKPEDKLTVTLTIEGVAKKVVWIDFNPKKYGHEGD